MLPGVQHISILHIWSLNYITTRKKRERKREIFKNTIKQVLKFTFDFFDHSQYNKKSPEHKLWLDPELIDINGKTPIGFNGAGSGLRLLTWDSATRLPRTFH